MPGIRKLSPFIPLFLILGCCESSNDEGRDGGPGVDAAAEKEAGIGGDVDADGDTDGDSDVGQDAGNNDYPYLVWAKMAGSDSSAAGGEGLSSEYGNGIDTYPSGDVVVTGGFESMITFEDGEPGETSLYAPGTETSDVFIARYKPDGEFLWAKNQGGEWWDHGTRISTLNDGGFLSTGYFESLAVFGKGEPNETFMQGKGIFFAKYRGNGTLLWVKKVDSSMFSGAMDTAVFSDGSFLMTGYYLREALFGEGEANETYLSVNDSYFHLFFARFYPDGTLAWVKQSLGSGTAVSYGLDAMPDGSACVVGYFEETPAWGPGEPGETFLTSNGGKDFFIARYRTDGSLVWARGIGSAEDDLAYSVIACPDGSCVMTGEFRDTVVLGHQEDRETILVSEGKSDIFIAVYDAEGRLVWAKQAGGVMDDWGMSLGMNTDGSVVLSGQFWKSAMFGINTTDETAIQSSLPDGSSIFLADYSSDGSLRWVRSAVDSADIRHMAVIDNGGIYLTGKFDFHALFGPGDPREIEFSLPAGPNEDMFIAKFAP